MTLISHVVILSSVTAGQFI